MIVRGSTLATLAALLLTPAPAIGADGVQPAVTLSNPPLQVFGEIDGQSAELRPGQAIPYRVGASCYNWRLAFDPVEGEVELDEVLVLPAPAAHWGSPRGTIVSRDRKSAR